MSTNQRKRSLAKSKHRKSDRPRLNTEPLNQIPQKRLFSYKVLLVLIVVIFGVIIWKKQSSAEWQSQHAVNQTLAANDRREQIFAERFARMAQLHQTHTRHIDILKPLAESDMFGYQIVRMLEDRAYYTIFVGSGVTTRLAEPQEDSFNNPTARILEITVSNPEELRANRFFVPATMQYARDRQQLILPEEDLFTELWFGLGIAHELSHAHDHLISGIEPTVGTESTYASGERRAYEFEIRLLKRALTQSGMARLIETTADALGPNAQPLVITNPPPPVWRDLDGFPAPSQSDTELGIRCGLAIVAVNFYLIEQRGGGDREKEEFLTTLHQTLGMPTN